jgi:hypothetical protein
MKECRMQPDFESFFRDYADAYNRSLGETVDAAAIRACFAEGFVGAGPSGVACGANDDRFAARLEEGFAFYRRIGTQRMALRRIDVTPIDPLHHLVKVFYRADYRKADGEPVSIDFDVTYLLQTRDGVSKVFGFIAGDEMAAYRHHGLL